MLARRIIPCLDVKDGRVVKGTSFKGLRDAGDPVECGAKYSDEGADELVFLDITATLESRETIVQVVQEVADRLAIPFTVGGGIRSVQDVRSLLTAGADKVSMNTAAVKDENLVTRASRAFGCQCIVVAIDALKQEDEDWWRVHIASGSQPTELDAVEWAREVERRGAGEILLTSIDEDGQQKGYDLELTARVSEAVNIPVIASGGAGGPEDLYNALTEGKADAALAASIFHYGTYSIEEVKQYLADRGLPVRL